MKFNKRSGMFIIVFCCLSAIGVLVSAIYAAYYGKGIFKDVFVNRKTYFSSDILENIPSLEQVESSVSKTVGTEQVALYNYDLSTGDYNELDLTVAIYARMADDTTNKTYTLTCNGTSFVVNKDVTFGDALFVVRLPGQKANNVIVTISYGYDGTEDVTAFSGLYVVAVPVEPSYMSSKYLGARLGPSQSNAFSVHAGFEYTTGNIENYAAFSYVVQMSGESETGDVVKLSWKSHALSLITENDSLPSGTTIQNDGEGIFDRYILIPPKAGVAYRLTFIRSDSSENNPWRDEENPVTWQMLAQFVNCEEVQS